MLDIFRSVLGTDEITPTSDFFDAGGDSLLATRLLAAVATRSGVELTFDDFLRARSPRTLAAKIRESR
jgi:acyl carrier protein